MESRDILERATRWAIDHFCSAASASESTESVKSDPPLGKHVVATVRDVADRA